MRKVFVATRPAEAHVVKGLLESEGIGAMVRAEASVWVLDTEQAGRAAELIDATQPGATSAARRERSWRCPACNEFVGPEFAACWKCLTPG